MCSVVLRGLIDHYVPAGDKTDRDEYTSDGEEFDVAMHWTSCATIMILIGQSVRVCTD
jgi:hypothetical protein